MLKKIGSIILFASTLFSSAAFAVQEFALQAGMTQDFILEPNEPLVFTNFLMWELKGTCTMLSENDDNLLTLTVLRKSGTINDTPLSAGEKISMVVHPFDNLYLTAMSRAKIELFNHEDKSVIARCTVN